MNFFQLSTPGPLGNMTSYLLPKLLFPKPKPSYTPDHHHVIWIADWLQPEDRDFDIPCLYLRSSVFARFFLVFFHANAEDLGTGFEFCSTLRLCFQAHVLAPELPGYGCSTQNLAPNEASIVRYAESAMRFLLQPRAQGGCEWRPENILLIGRSIGCISALDLASRYADVGGLCLVTPFSSLHAVVEERVGSVVAAVIVPDKTAYDNAARVKSVRADTLIIHGVSDQVVQKKNSDFLYSLCTAKRAFVSPPDMAHNVSLFSNHTFFLEPVLQFFSLPDYVFEANELPSLRHLRRARETKSSSSLTGMTIWDDSSVGGGRVVAPGFTSSAGGGRGDTTVGASHAPDGAAGYFARSDHSARSTDPLAESVPDDELTGEFEIDPEDLDEFGPTDIPSVVSGRLHPPRRPGSSSSSQILYAADLDVLVCSSGGDSSSSSTTAGVLEKKPAVVLEELGPAGVKTKATTRIRNPNDSPEVPHEAVKIPLLALPNPATDKLRRLRERDHSLVGRVGDVPDEEEEPAASEVLAQPFSLQPFPSSSSSSGSGGYFFSGAPPSVRGPPGDRPRTRAARPSPPSENRIRPSAGAVGVML